MRISFFPEILFEIMGWPVSNTIISAWVAMALLIVMGLFVRSRLKPVPGKMQNIVEALIEGMEGFMTTVTGDKEKTRKFFPLIATFFLFILFSNWLGILPGVGSFTVGHGVHHVPLFRAPAADLNFTLAFAVISVLVTNVLGAIAVGVRTHIGKYLNFTNPINFFIGILEIVSEVAKIISLSFRLFGNVFAGEVLLIIIFSLAPYVIPLPFLFLELFVGIIQAFLFAMLTLVSISLHTAVHEQH